MRQVGIQLVFLNKFCGNFHEIISLVHFYGLLLIFWYLQVDPKEKSLISLRCPGLLHGPIPLVFVLSSRIQNTRLLILILIAHIHCGGCQRAQRIDLRCFNRVGIILNYTLVVAVVRRITHFLQIDIFCLVVFLLTQLIEWWVPAQLFGLTLSYWGLVSGWLRCIFGDQVAAFGRLNVTLQLLRSSQNKLIQVLQNYLKHLFF